MEEIDILMATYNGEKYLKEQVESILNQSYSNFRLIISDDCSTDKTREILSEYEKKDFYFYNLCLINILYLKGISANK